MKNPAQTVFIILLLLAGTHCSFAQGMQDPGFNTGTGADGIVNAVAIQPDGKMIIAGGFDNINGNTNCLDIARLNADGSVDNTFNPGTSTDFSIFCAALQPDGKIIIGGMFDTYQGVDRSHLARLNADGSLDTSFDPGSGTDDYINSVSLQPDGKVVIGGYFTSYNGTARSGIARVNADGSLDAGFDPGSGVDYAVFTTSLLTNGTILIGGGFTLYNGFSRRGIAQIETNGSVDPAFSPGSVSVDSIIFSIVAQNDGKLIIGGAFSEFNNVSRSKIARLNSNGTLDTGFDPGTGFDDTVHCLGIQPNGKIVAGGYFLHMNSVSRRGVARLLPNGNLDVGFDRGTNVDEGVQTLALQKDAKVLLGGYFNEFNGAPDVELARLLLADSQPAPLSIKIQATPGKAILSWNSATNGIYRVQYRSSLITSAWTNLTPDIVATSNVTSLTNSPGTNTVRFYRTALVPF